ncbi:glutamate decarboxylase [Shigella sonnei]|nr:glutamate decarboxylase [Shigella sonnei]
MVTFWGNYEGISQYKASLKYLSDHPKLQGIAQQNSFKHT